MGKTISKKLATSGERWTKYRETRQVVVTYLTPDQHAAFKAMSSDKGRSMSSQLAQLVKAFTAGEIAG